jgi:hypothetical protein
MSAVVVIKPITKGVTKDVYDTVKESLLKDVKDADWKTVRNYSLLAIGFSILGYLMYRNKSSVYSSIESMVYTKEERIHRRMVEWNRSAKGVEDHNRFCQALIAEISTRSDLSWEFMKSFINFLNVNKESFGPHITILDFCRCVENRKDYSENVWYLLLFMSTMVDENFLAQGMNDPLLISARDILHNILRDLPDEATDNKVCVIAQMYKFIFLYVYNDPASYRVYFPEPVWDRILAAFDNDEYQIMAQFYRHLRDNFTE